MNGVVEAIIVLVIILVSMILHELMHGLVAYWLGDTTAKDDGRLTLNPISHIDPYMSLVLPMVLYLIGAPVFGGAKPVPINSRNLKWREWGMALVAIAGPFTNFMLAFVGFLVFRFGGQSEIALTFTSINLGFMIFNLLPIPPLDGSRVLYALAPDKVREAMTRMESYGVFIVYGLILVLGGVFSSLMIGAMNGVWRFFFFITNPKNPPHLVNYHQAIRHKFYRRKPQLQCLFHPFLQGIILCYPRRCKSYKFTASPQHPPVFPQNKISNPRRPRITFR